MVQNAAVRLFALLTQYVRLWDSQCHQHMVIIPQTSKPSLQFIHPKGVV